MKRVSEFLKTTASGGLFVLLPLLLLYLVVAEAVGLFVALATPVADLFPKGTFDHFTSPFLLALVLLVGVAFLIGLVLRLGAARQFERSVLNRLPMYNVLKSLTMGFTEAGESTAFKPAMLKSKDGSLELAYLVEDHKDGSVTVLLPIAPMLLTGSVKIVNRDWVETLDMNLGEFTKVLGLWGVGAHAITAKCATGENTK